MDVAGIRTATLSHGMSRLASNVLHAGAMSPHDVRRGTARYWSVFDVGTSSSEKKVHHYPEHAERPILETHLSTSLSQALRVNQQTPRIS